MLNIDLSAVVVQSLAFILLILFMGKFAFGPVSKYVDDRQSEIQQTLDQIAADRRAMEQSRAEYEQRLSNIEAQAREHIAESVQQAQQEAAAIVARANAEADEHRKRAVLEIEQERKKAVAEIRTEMADLAVMAAAKILQREINPAVHRDLINNFISDLGTAG